MVIKDSGLLNIIFSFCVFLILQYKEYVLIKFDCVLLLYE